MKTYTKSDLEDKYRKLLKYLKEHYHKTQYEKGQIDLLQQLIKEI